MRPDRRRSSPDRLLLGMRGLSRLAIRQLVFDAARVETHEYERSGHTARDKLDEHAAGSRIDVGVSRGGRGQEDDEGEGGDRGPVHGVPNNVYRLAMQDLAVNRPRVGDKTQAPPFRADDNPVRHWEPWC